MNKKRQIFIAAIAVLCLWLLTRPMMVFYRNEGEYLTKEQSARFMEALSDVGKKYRFSWAEAPYISYTTFEIKGVLSNTKVDLNCPLSIICINDKNYIIDPWSEVFDACREILMERYSSCPANPVPNSFFKYSDDQLFPELTNNKITDFGVWFASADISMSRISEATGVKLNEIDTALTIDELFNREMRSYSLNDVLEYGGLQIKVIISRFGNEFLVKVAE